MANDPRLIDMAGRQCGDWMVLRKAGNQKHGGATWLSRCACGTEREVLGKDLRNGKSRNCGCKRADRARVLSLTHGGSGTRLHRIWQLMLQRCRDTKDARYGGRGITVCLAWHSFERFRDWANANGYRDDLSIDRVDGDKGYNPQNCRWASALTQARNTCRVRKTSDGRPGIEVAEENGIVYGTYKDRLRRGWSVDRAATQPAQR